MQVDEYKQLKESLSKMPNLRQPEQNSAPQQPQAAAAAQQTRMLEQPHKDEPAHEEDHQHTESKVMWDSLGSLYY